MAARSYRYIIIGGGLAGASAASGIRERDRQGSVLLIGRETHAPYDRPPLSKQLWLGRKRVEQIFLHDRAHYEQTSVELKLGTHIAAIDVRQKLVKDAQGQEYRFEKLLLATGGTPRVLPIPGGDLPGVCYFRSLDDYERLRAAATGGKSAVVIGGGFIGSEMAAALKVNGLDVTMVFPAPYLCHRVFPEALGRAVQDEYKRRGVHVLAGDAPTEIVPRGDRYIIWTRGGRKLETDLVVAGIGIVPAMGLAAAAGLRTGDGIEVNEQLQTSHPDVYAAGDNASFPYPALGRSVRIEHWDNALSQGQCAGRNMAGALEAYTHLPYFFSDLFEFGYEAVGDVDAKLTTMANWEEENRKGTVYYLREGRVCGVMMCNVWGQVEAARELIRRGARWPHEELRSAVRLSEPSVHSPSARAEGS